MPWLMTTKQFLWLPEEVNTQAIIEKNFSIMLKGRTGRKVCEKFSFFNGSIRTSGNLYGLTMSVGRLVELLSTSGNSDACQYGLHYYRTYFLGRGMAVAFNKPCRCWGSIVITVLGIVINIEESQSLMVQWRIIWITL